ncbi:hypothetical protein ACIQU5_33530 [Streptomyces sp. NPDC090306]|uniref:hypothetical protein n=1 Tax=Streptomyces sp. NPDC090306 TaxID=3365961 RepID=UPI0038094070
MADQQSPRAHFVADPIHLPDGRTVCVSAYPDGGIHFSVDGLPYVLTEACLSGNPEKDRATLKISPGRQGSNASYNYTDWLEEKNSK